MSANGSYLVQASVFLIQTLFGLYLIAILLRILLQKVRADFYNPIVQFLVKITNPVLFPLRRWIPGFFGWDCAAIVLLFILKIVELLLTLSILNFSLSFAGLLVLALAELLDLLLNVLLWTILIRVVMSWLNPDYRQPIVQLLYQITEPVLRPARGLIPLVSGLDLSPIAVAILLQLTKMLLVIPLRDIGFYLM